MDPLTVSLGMKLLSHVPDIVGIFAGKKKAEAAKKIVDMAEKVTGKKQDSAVAAIEKDPALALEFQKLVYAEKHELERMFLEDVADAREMNTQSAEMGKLSSRTADQIMRWNLPAVGLLIIAQCIVLIMLEDKIEIVALVSNAIGFVINSLLNERQQVTGFLFGSSMGSKLKTLIKKDDES